MTDGVEPFRIAIPQPDVDELRDRLARTPTEASRPQRPLQHQRRCRENLPPRRYGHCAPWDAEDVYAQARGELRRLERRGALHRLAHCYYIVVPQDLTRTGADHPGTRDGTARTRVVAPRARVGVRRGLLTADQYGHNCYADCSHLGVIMSVGVRELRDGLSRHLAHVRSGHTVTVTDHGVPVARIVPISSPSALERLVAEGRVTPAKQSKRPAGRRVRTAGTVSDLVTEQRR